MKKNITLIIILFAVILTACEGTEVPEENADVLMTSAVGSMVASFFGTQTAMFTPPASASAFTATIQPLASSTVIYPTTTLVPLSTATFIYYSATPTAGTITPTGTQPTPTVNSAALAVGCNNLAFIRDVNIPAGTVIEKNQVFTKTWKVQNIGTCNWLSQYTLVSAGGDTLGGENLITQKPVLIGNWSELSVELQAPNAAGTYTGYWRLSNNQSMFGATLAVSIVVKDAATDVPATATLSPTTTPTLTYTPTLMSTPTPTP